MEERNESHVSPGLVKQTNDISQILVKSEVVFRSSLLELGPYEGFVCLDYASRKTLLRDARVTTTWRKLLPTSPKAPDLTPMALGLIYRSQMALDLGPLTSFALPSPSDSPSQKKSADEDSIKPRTLIGAKNTNGRQNPSLISLKTVSVTTRFLYLSLSVTAKTSCRLTEVTRSRRFEMKCYSPHFPPAKMR